MQIQLRTVPQCPRQRARVHKWLDGQVPMRTQPLVMVDHPTELIAEEVRLEEFLHLQPDLNTALGSIAA